MIADKTYTSQPVAFSLKSKFRDYGQLVKMRLNLTVVFSTFIGFLLGAGEHIEWLNLAIVCCGGFLTVGAANGINQIIERDSDKLMRRTENRPLAQNRMDIPEAVIACLIMGALGVWLIGHFLNPLSGILSFVSLCLYSFVYTPLKKVSPINVHVGAIPGALPPLIGYVAATGRLDAMAIFLFAIQFVWQFPHFYSIAWLLDDDYKRAGLKMMPIGARKDKSGALQIACIAFLLIPLSFVPYIYGLGSLWAGFALGLCSSYFFYLCMNLLKDLGNKSAKKVMFGGIMYLPIILIIILIDKFI